METGAEALAVNKELVSGELVWTNVSTFALRKAKARRLGEVRIPLALAYRPKAAAWRLPDGRTLWCVRLWEFDRPTTRVVSTATLARYCRRSRLVVLAGAVERIGGA